MLAVFEIIGIIIAAIVGVGMSGGGCWVFGKYLMFKTATSNDEPEAWQLLAGSAGLLLGVEAYLIYEGFRHSLLLPEVIGPILFVLYLGAGGVGFWFGSEEIATTAEKEKIDYYQKNKKEEQGRAEAKSWDWNERLERESKLLQAVFVQCRAEIGAKVAPAELAERLGWKIGAVAEIADALADRGVLATKYSEWKSFETEGDQKSLSPTVVPEKTPVGLKSITLTKKGLKVARGEVSGPGGREFGGGAGRGSAAVSFAGNVLANMVAAILGSALIFGWGILTSSHKWSWHTLPRFSFIIHPIIWAWIVPLAINFCAESAPKVGFTKKGPTLNGMISWATFWPFLLALLVWLGPKHTPPFEIWNLREHILPVTNYIARTFADLSVFTSVYCLLVPFGLVISFIAGVVRSGDIFVRVK